MFLACLLLSFYVIPSGLFSAGQTALVGFHQNCLKYIMWYLPILYCTLPERHKFEYMLVRLVCFHSLSYDTLHCSEP
jgi:hypothetical protein